MGAKWRPCPICGRNIQGEMKYTHIQRKHSDLLCIEKRFHPTAHKKYLYCLVCHKWITGGYAQLVNHIHDRKTLIEEVNRLSVELTMLEAVWRMLRYELEPANDSVHGKDC